MKFTRLEERIKNVIFLLINLFIIFNILYLTFVKLIFFLQVMDVYGIEMDVHQHMAVILIPIMLSTWIRNLKYLVPVSSMANFLVIAGYIATMYIMCNDLPSIHERRYIADWHDLPLFFGTVIYSFEGITLVSCLYIFRIYIMCYKFGNKSFRPYCCRLY